MSELNFGDEVNFRLFENEEFRCGRYCGKRFSDEHVVEQNGVVLLVRPQDIRRKPRVIKQMMQMLVSTGPGVIKHFVVVQAGDVIKGAGWRKVGDDFEMQCEVPHD